MKNWMNFPKRLERLKAFLIKHKVNTRLVFLITGSYPPAGF